MKGHMGRCGCGATLYWKPVRGEMEPREVDRFGQVRQLHICCGGRTLAQKIADGHADLYAACPYLRPEEDR